MTYTIRLAGLRLKSRGTDWHTHLAWLTRVEQQHIKETVK